MILGSFLYLPNIMAATSISRRNLEVARKDNSALRLFSFAVARQMLDYIFKSVMQL